MKKLRKSLLAVLLVVGLVIPAFVACGGEKYDYKITVLGLDGKPYTEAAIQPCNAGGTSCYNVWKTVDKNGVAYFNIEEDKLPEGVEHFEFHVHKPDKSELPIYLTYDLVSARAHKGDSITIQLKEKVEALVGKGTATVADGKIDTSSFDPYKADLGEEGKGAAYKVKFTSADQKIYFAFQGDKEVPGVYKVYAVGGTNTKILLLEGNVEAGINVTGDAKDITSAPYEFHQEGETVEDGKTVTKNDGISYFEVTSAANDEVIICFEYVTDYNG